MQPTDLLILSLATFSMAYLLVREDAPFKLMAKLRAVSTFGGLLSCIHCSAFWCAILCYVLLSTPLAPIVYVFAIRGGMQFMYRYTGGDMLQ